MLGLLIAMTASPGSNRGSDTQQLLGILEKDLALDGLRWREAAERGDRLRSLTLGAAADGVEAVAPVEDLVLVAPQELAGVVLVASQGVQARARGHVGVRIGIVRQITVRQSAGGHLPLRIEDLLVGVIAVDVGPPRLGVANKDRLRVLLEHRVEAVEAEVVGLVLEMEQDRHPVFRRQGVEDLTLRRVARHAELLLADDDRAGLEIPL